MNAFVKAKAKTSKDSLSYWVDLSSLHHQDIDKKSTEINRHKVEIATGQKTIKKLTKGIEEAKKEKERVVGEKEKMVAAFKEIEQKAFVAQENYKKTQEVFTELLF